MLFAALHESAYGTSLRSLLRNNSVAFGAKRTTVETGAEWVGSE
jgi:hypothetical protein